MIRSWKDLACVCCSAEYRTHDQQTHADENGLQPLGAAALGGSDPELAACSCPCAAREGWLWKPSYSLNLAVLNFGSE